MDKTNFIQIRGARENNLKNINLTIPKNSLTVFTGVSGSGKTTLAFDTIYNEGQRRYVESLSSYARQFLGGVDKPDVDAIDGLSPAISIDQKTTSHNPRSTVGTVTEINDYLRLLFARIGVPYCPTHHEPIVAFSIAKMCEIALSYPIDSKLIILSPVVRAEKGTHKDTIAKLKSDGFVRFRVDDKFIESDALKELDKNKRHNIDIVVDRLIVKDGIKERLNEAISLATDYSRGYVILYVDGHERLLSQHHSCKYCGFSVPKIEPRLFSFNAPMGYCPDCKGLGLKREVAIDLLIPDPGLSIMQGAIRYYKNTAGTTNLEWQEFKYLCEQYKVDLHKPWNKLTKFQQDILLNGSDKPFKYVLTSASGNKNNRFGYIEGIKKKIERLYSDTTSEWMSEYYLTYMRDTVCTTCHGARLNKEALAIKINKLNIHEVCSLPIEDLAKWLNELDKALNRTEKEIGQQIIKEIKNRVSFLLDVGLSYLTLSRMSMTLSGGESQRIRLATQIGSKLSGVIYVLDEPSIGLHQRDNQKLINSLKSMRDLGNTLIVVEHDEETMENADYIVDIGPRAGVHGGEVVYAGNVAGIKKCKASITGKYLTGEERIEVPTTRKKGNGKFLEIKGAKCHNLKNIDVKIPLGTFTAITGVSGSGKSTLINETLAKAVRKALTNEDTFPGEHKEIKGLTHIDKLIQITQEPIGRTPRSNPATYTKVFDDIRELFAETIEAKTKGFDKGRFSFNIPGGRCESCWGDGVKRIPMNFLPDVYVKCEECGGKRYNEETLSVTYKGKNIYDVLEMTVEEALTFFENRPKIKQKIQTLYDVGLGYIKLGQQATTLSGGEAQRIKLAYELQKRATGKTLFVLDEPTTGLHSDDVKHLIAVLKRIVNNGDTVVVIEHNLDMIKVADYIIDLGPEGGNRGGEVIATGTPEAVSKMAKSYTGQFLKRVLQK
ncbi:MAG: excinuclease ABC subunit UvrA [Bacilli bacterium]|nr:excinuclease ABC subunit UvrA [Bacilli bacterium]